MTPKRDAAVGLLLVSALALFYELAFIRWLPSQVLSLAYYSNIVLIASFLGLGLGCLAADRRDVFPAFPAILAAVLAAVVFLRRFEVVARYQDEWVWSAYAGNQYSHPALSIGILPAIGALFILVAAAFFPLGQETGRLMDAFPRLRAYSLNVAGSLAGIAGFTGLCFLAQGRAAPLAWFGCAGAATLWFFRKRPARLGLAAAAAVAACALVGAASRQMLWSPYYSIRLRPGGGGSFYVYVNDFFHQEAINFGLDPEGLAKYSLPYQLKTPKKLLILGAGTGNDVSVALRRGVPEIDAVEIDPLIADLGRRFHPEHPYAAASVHLTIDDARSFLQRTDKKYDMIVLGTLDSHALLSGMSTVRLDNFVYTVESLQAIKRHLEPDGLAVLMFSVPADWLGENMLRLCLKVFPDPSPVFYLGDDRLFNLMVLAGPGVPEAVSRLRAQPLRFHRLNGDAKGGDVPTDDWPYLYLKGRGVPAHYVKAVAALALVAALAIVLAMGERARSFDGAAFCLGGAFMLLETKAVTTLSLLFGSTWLVNAFVFGSILAMVLAGNLAASRLKSRGNGLVYALLGLALLADYLLPVSALSGLRFWPRAFAGSLAMALPILLAAVIFAQHLERGRGRSVASVIGANLAGAVVGGFLEYASMATGLRSLFLLAGALYLGAFLLEGEGRSLLPDVG